MDQSTLFLPISNRFHKVNTLTTSSSPNDENSRISKLQSVLEQADIGRIVVGHDGICAIFKNDAQFVKSFNKLAIELSDQVYL